MRFRGYFLALALASLTACGGATTPPVSNGSAAAPEPPTSRVKAISADAMYSAEAAYNVPAHAYVTADAKGLLTPEIKAKVKPIMVDAFAALKKARLAYAAVDNDAFDLAYEVLRTKASAASKLLP